MQTLPYPLKPKIARLRNIRRQSFPFESMSTQRSLENQSNTETFGNLLQTPSLLDKKTKKGITTKSQPISSPPLSLILPSTLKKDKTTQNLKHSLPENIPVLGQVLQIYIYSNWGDPDQISLSSIVLMDIDKNTIPVFSAAVYPHERGTRDPMILFEKNIIKSNESIWTSPFNPKKVPLIISFIIPAQRSIYYIRILNNINKQESGARRIEILYNSIIYLKIELPKGFGINESTMIIPTTNPKPIIKLLKDIQININNSPIFDKFGRFPIASLSEIKFQVISTYGERKCFGLNYIKMIDSNGSNIDVSLINSVIISDGEALTEPMNLFKNQESDQGNEMFCVKAVIESKPHFSISFIHPVTIVGIIIGNYNGFNLSYGIYHLKIFNGTNEIWRGAIKKGDGTLYNIVPKSTFIPFTDIPSFYLNNL